MTVPDNLKATTPSKAAQGAIDTAWNAGQGKTPEQQLAEQHTKNPVDPSSLK